MERVERVVERVVEDVLVAVAQAGVERGAVPRAAPEVELLPAVRQLPAVTVVPNPATRTHLVSVSMGVANVLNSRRKRYDTI